jgi:dTDP-4-dehydrorhamnose 3,5-epimerase
VIFEPLDLAGAFLVLPEPIEDERGAFARLYCAETFAAHGLDPRLDQISLSFNRRAGTLRGLHLQRPPVAETKLIRVTAGAIWDVIVDVRAGSPTFGQWRAVELSAANRRQLYVPAGLAHGFQSLTDGAEITYHISVPYRAEAQDGVRWDDPDLAIPWPAPQAAILSDRDRALPLLSAFKPVEAPC